MIDPLIHLGRNRDKAEACGVVLEGAEIGIHTAQEIGQARARESTEALVAAILRSSVADGSSESVEEDIRAFSGSLEGDEAFRRSLRLAELVHEIGRQGERELEACERILDSFAAYLRTRNTAS